MKKYNIGETARILNLSQSLLRHYEELQLIDPMRDANGYRSFQVKDIDVLFGIRRFRNMGFSLKEIEGMFHNGSSQGTEKMFSKRIRELEQELSWKKNLLHAMKRNHRELVRIKKSLGKFELSKTPEALRIQSRINDTYLLDNLTEESLRWVRCLPVVAISPEFPLEAIREGRKEVGFGFMVPFQLAEQLNLERTSQTRYYPVQPCVTTVVYSQGKEKISTLHLQDSLEYLLKEGYQSDGDPWGITVGTYWEGNEVRRFHRVFLPIKK